MPPQCSKDAKLYPDCSMPVGSHIRDVLCRLRGIKTASASDTGKDIRWTFCRTVEPACGYLWSFRRTRASTLRLPAISKEMLFAPGSSMWSRLRRLVLQRTCPHQKPWAESGKPCAQSGTAVCFKTPNIPGANYYHSKNKHWNSSEAKHWQGRQCQEIVSLALRWTKGC